MMVVLDSLAAEHYAGPRRQSLGPVMEFPASDLHIRQYTPLYARN